MKDSLRPRVELVLDGQELTIDDVVQLARQTDPCVVTLATDARTQISRSKNLKDSLIDADLPIYGVTTGFGANSLSLISKRKGADLQENLLSFLSCGSGPFASPETARATMVVRANCLALGCSGVRPELIELLIACLNEDILPLIPERGSVGASGDLVPLSYLASMLTGKGLVLHRGIQKSAEQALREVGLTKMDLIAKEGLALVNGTSFMSGYAVLAVHDAERLAAAAEQCTALACQVLLGDPGHFSDFLVKQKPYPGMLESAAAIRDLLAPETSGSSDAFSRQKELKESGRLLQDQYSLRCAPHIIGVLRDTIAWVKKWLEIEVNSANDNPLFDTTTGTVHNGGNFYGGHVGQAMDALKIAVASVGDMLDRQLQLIVDSKFNNGLSPNLIPWVEAENEDFGLFHGFKGMQIACSALTAEALKWTNPATAFSRSTESHNQDKVSMGTIAARDARSVVELVERIAAIHLIALCQAADLRGLDRLSTPTREIHHKVRAVSRFLDRDRPLGEDIERVAEMIKSGALEPQLTTSLPHLRLQQA